jgi:hypothetical protein
MTKEELVARRDALRAEREERIKLMPAVQIRRQSVGLILEAGDATRLTIEWRQRVRSKAIQSRYLVLSLDELLALLSGVAARYNVSVERANDRAADVRLVNLAATSEGAPCE